MSMQCVDVSCVMGMNELHPNREIYHYGSLDCLLLW